MALLFCCLFAAHEEAASQSGAINGVHAGFVEGHSLSVRAIKSDGF